MPGKVRKCLRDKTIYNVLRSNLSETDKDCILEVFVRYEHLLYRALPEVRHGEWVPTLTFGWLLMHHHWNCSVCGAPSDNEGLENYCPNCGAKMDGSR